MINVYPDRFLSPKDSIKEAIERTKDGVTAWVCAADHVGYDLISNLEKAGIKVPNDVSVIGFDGISSPLKNITYQQLRFRIDLLAIMPLRDFMKLLKILTIKAN